MNYKLSYPAITPGAVVTEGHANYCKEHGHATHKVDGVVSPLCPRCGDKLSEAPSQNPAPGTPISVMSENTVVTLTGDEADDYRRMHPTDLEKAHAEALSMNERVVYVDGHGTRAYMFIERCADLVTVRPLSGGMEWSHGVNIVGMTPFVAKCQCEHKDHFRQGFRAPVKHDYLEIAAGEQKALFVGPVCDDCAATCMADLLK